MGTFQFVNGIKDRSFRPVTSSHKIKIRGMMKPVKVEPEGRTRKLFKK